MDYIWTVNGKEVKTFIVTKIFLHLHYQVFGMTQPQITNEIINSQLKMTMEVERGTFIVPSFDEIWPQAGKERSKARKRMGMDYILEVSSNFKLILLSIATMVQTFETISISGYAAPWSGTSATAR